MAHGRGRGGSTRMLRRRVALSLLRGVRVTFRRGRSSRRARLVGVGGVGLCVAATGASVGVTATGGTWWLALPVLVLAGVVAVAHLVVAGQIQGLVESSAGAGSGRQSGSRKWRDAISVPADHFQRANRLVLTPAPAVVRAAPPLDGRPPSVDARSGHVPAVSVVVTAYNHADLLSQALASVQRQDLTDWECIVVDDGSTDQVVDVASAFAAADTRFRVVCHTQNAGLPAARNTGVLDAAGRYVTFLDADDVMFPESLSSRLAVTTDDPQCAGVYCDWRSVWGPEVPDLPRGGSSPHGRVTALTRPWDCPFIASAPLVRRDVVLALGGFDERLDTAEDADLWARVLRSGYYFDYAPYVGIGYRQIRHGMIRRTAARHAATIQRIAATQEEPISDELVARGPMPLHEPLSHYVREKLLLERLLRFLVMALATGDREGARRLADAFSPEVLRLHPDERFIDNAVVNALRRMGWDTPDHVLDAQQVRAEADRLLEEVAARHPARALPVAGLDSGPLERVDLRAREQATGSPLVQPLRQVRVLSDLSVRDPSGAVLMVPESRYHVDELGPLAVELRRRGRRVVFMAKGARVLRHEVLLEIGRYDEEVLEWDPGLPSKVPLAAVVTLNDWGPCRELLECAHARGVPTFAKVEGVQDFADVDVGHERRPYHTATLVLAQGRNDARALAGRPVEVVGNSRLERIWREHRLAPAVRTALVNLNFTYHVQIEHADAWLRGCLEAAGRAGLKAVVSPHPAQKADVVSPDLLAGRLATAPLRHMLTCSGVLVTRFSTVVYEAAARGVPVIYHNPHGEKVWEHIAESDEAVLTTRSSRELAEAMQRAIATRDGYRERARSFFEAQVSVEERSAAERAADVVCGVLDDAQVRSNSLAIGK